jgi:hypothetical protein
VTAAEKSIEGRDLEIFVESVLGEEVSSPPYFSPSRLALLILLASSESEVHSPWPKVHSSLRPTFWELVAKMKTRSRCA